MVCCRSFTQHKDCQETVTMAWTRCYDLAQGTRASRYVWPYPGVTRLIDKRQAQGITFKVILSSAVTLGYGLL